MTSILLFLCVGSSTVEGLHLPRQVWRLVLHIRRGVPLWWWCDRSYRR